MQALLEELLRFPQSKFTDRRSDSISQALAYEGSTYTLEFLRLEPKRRASIAARADPLSIPQN